MKMNNMGELTINLKTLLCKIKMKEVAKQAQEKRNTT
jgi:hypothetical protein